MSGASGRGRVPAAPPRPRPTAPAVTGAAAFVPEPEQQSPLLSPTRFSRSHRRHHAPGEPQHGRPASQVGAGRGPAGWGLGKRGPQGRDSVTLAAAAPSWRGRGGGTAIRRLRRWSSTLREEERVPLRSCGPLGPPAWSPAGINPASSHPAAAAPRPLPTRPRTRRPRPWPRPPPRRASPA